MLARGIVDSGRLVLVPSRYSMIAIDCVIICPSISSVGTNACGFFALYALLCWSLFMIFTARYWYCIDLRCSAMRTRHALELAKNEKSVGRVFAVELTDLFKNI
jgi:hypothetical protein